MSVAEKVVDRPVTIIVLFAIVVAFGIYLTWDIPLEQTPDIEMPMLIVSTTYSGAGPEEVEKTITRTLEGTLLSLSGLKNMTSSSSEGACRVILEFVWGTDITEATNDVRDALDRVKNALPDGAGTPQIFKFNMSSLPILQIALEGNMTVDELRLLAENRIQPLLEQVEGVAITSLMGGRQRAIMVRVAQDRLDAYGLTISSVASTLASQNVQIAGGTFQEGDMRYVVRAVGEFTSVEDIENAVVTYKRPTNSTGAAKPVLLKDIATVTDDYEDSKTKVTIDGKPGIYISVQKQSGSNSVTVADTVIKRIDELNTNGALPSGVRLFVIRNDTAQTKAALSQVFSTAYEGAILAVIVLFIFLRRFRTTLIVGISIPVSILVTIICMYFMHISMNILSLTGLSLGVGMMVDNSIVVLENMYSYRFRGAKLRTAAIIGTREMTLAISASTITTVCVFLPLFIFKGNLEMIGVLMNDLSFTVIASLLASLVVAALLVPVLGSRYLPIVTKTQKTVKNPTLRAIDDFMERMLAGLDNAYKRGLSVVLDHKLIFAFVVICLVLGTLFYIPKLGFNLMPSMVEDNVRLSLTMPLGTPIERTEEVLNGMEEIILKEVTGHREIIVTSGGGMLGWFGGSSTNQGSITVNLPPFKERIENSNEVKAKLRKHFNDFPDARFSFGIGMNALAGGSAEITVKCDDLDKGKATALAIKSLIEKNVPDITEVDIDLEDGLPELELIIDREKANALGVNISAIGSEIAKNIGGTTATIYRSGGNEYDVIVRLRDEDKETEPDLEKIFVISSSTGGKVPVANFATFKKGTGPVTINREMQTRVIHVTGNFAPNAATTIVMDNVKSLIAANIPLEEDVELEYGGSYSQINDMLFELFKILIMAIVLVFAVMAIQFESFKDPFIILFTVPLMAIGVVGFYVISKQALTMFSIVGIVMLVGIVVNNGIVLVDYTNLLMKRGLPVKEACVTAGGNRLRPILMTTLTTILGLIPMAFFPGEGSEMWQPFGQTVVFGLTVSTMFTLFFIPVIYAIFNRKGLKSMRKELEAQEAGGD